MSGTLGSSRPISAKKLKYEQTLTKCLDTYKKCLLINVDNVGSLQMATLRKELRGSATILMGKNTVIRTILRKEVTSRPELESLLKVIRFNIGFVFTNGDLMKIRDRIVENQAPAAAKPGILAPADVYIEAGPTGLDPGQTSFFQAMNIGTKINKGSIDIASRTKVCTEGAKVSMSASVLLSKLGIKPFFYGIKVKYVFEGGSTYNAKVLDLTEADIMRLFSGGMTQGASLSLGLGYPSTLSVPHLLGAAVKKLIAVCIETKYNIPCAVPYKEALGLNAPAAAAEEKKAAPAAAAAADDDDDDDESE